MTKFTPIPPDPKRLYPPPHVWMDEDGLWWEAPGKRWTLKTTISGVKIVNCGVGVRLGDDGSDMRGPDWIEFRSEPPTEQER